MQAHHLVFEQQLAAGEHVRIWRQKDGQFSFEHLLPTGKGRTITCPTIEEAMLLWQQAKARPRPI